MRMPVATQGRWAAPHGRPCVGLGVVLVLAAMLLLPLAYNGFPLLFSDSGAYYLTFRVNENRFLSIQVTSPL